MKKLITIFTLILLSSLSAFADVENPFDVSFPIFSEADVFIKSQKIVCTGDHLFIDYVISANVEKSVSAVINCEILGYQRCCNDFAIPKDFCIKSDGKEIPFEVYRNGNLMEKGSYYSDFEKYTGEYPISDKIEIKFDFDLDGEKTITVSYENLRIHGMYNSKIQTMLAKNPDGKPIDYTFIYEVDDKAKLDRRILYPFQFNLQRDRYDYAGQNSELTFFPKKEKSFSLEAELKQYTLKYEEEYFSICFEPMFIDVIEWSNPHNLVLSSEGYSVSLTNEELSEDFLLYLTKSQLAFLRNAIYAFHGYKFKNKTYSEIFSSNYEHWYKINPNFTEKDFNEIEKANINLIKKYEER